MQNVPAKHIVATVQLKAMERVSSRLRPNEPEEMTDPSDWDSSSLFHILLEIESELRQTTRRNAFELDERLQFFSSYNGSPPSCRAGRLSRYIE